MNILYYRTSRTGHSSRHLCAGAASLILTGNEQDNSIADHLRLTDPVPTAEQMLASSVTLVTLPAIFVKVKRVVDDENATATDLTKVISADPALTARILKLVNSAFWGFSGRIDSVSRAVLLLGMVHVHDLVLATAVVEAFDRVRPEQMDVAKFWRGSVRRALAAIVLARRSKLMDLGRVFTEALLSDLGHMVIYMKVPELAARAMQQAQNQPWELAQAERSLLGCDFAQIGGALVDGWKLPPCYGEAIRHQNDPQGSPAHALEASLLHIAGFVAEILGLTSESAAMSARIAPFAWQTIRLSPDCLPEVMAEVEDNLSATASMFGLPLLGSG